MYKKRYSNKQDMVVLSTLSIFAALIGGVGAVIIGQVLSLYRDDIDSARYARYQLNYVQLLSKNEFSIGEMERISNKMKNNIEDAAREDMWLFSDEGKILLVKLVHDLNKLEYAASRGETEKIELNIESISERCEKMDGEIAYVTFRGSLRRYFGDERPYSDYSAS